MNALKQPGDIDSLALQLDDDYFTITMEMPNGDCCDHPLPVVFEEKCLQGRTLRGRPEKPVVARH